MARILDLARLLSHVQISRVIQALDAGKLSPGDRAFTVQDTTGLVGIAASAVSSVLRLWHQDSRTAAELSIALSIAKTAQQQAGERQSRISLVWTGPLEAGAQTRSTLVVLEELIKAAEQTIAIIGYTITSGAASVLANLVEARQRGVQITIIANRIEQYLAILRSHWPAGVAPPELFTYPQSSEDPMAALHAKAVIIDQKRMLLTSANLTYHGLNGNIELGVLIEDEAAAKAVQLVQLLIDRQIVLPVLL